MDRTFALAAIEENIRTHGYHIYTVQGGPVPRFSYTIGLHEAIGKELVFAGGAFYSLDDVASVLDSICLQLRSGGRNETGYAVPKLGMFTLRSVHQTWAREILLGALDYYSIDVVPSLQIFPERTHLTIDVPDLTRAWSPISEPIWQWLKTEWQYSVPANSTATTNLDALRGCRVTEAARWDMDEWELFAGAGPDVSTDDARIVPLGTLLAADPSLFPVIGLEVGKGIWREPHGGDWHRWETDGGKEGPR